MWKTHDRIWNRFAKGFKRWLVDFGLLNQLVSGISQITLDELDELDEFTRNLHLNHLKLFQVLKLEIKTERSNMCRYTTDSKSPGLMFSLNFSRFVRSIRWIEREQRNCFSLRLKANRKFKNFLRKHQFRTFSLDHVLISACYSHSRIHPSNSFLQFISRTLFNSFSNSSLEFICKNINFPDTTGNTLHKRRLAFGISDWPGGTRVTDTKGSMQKHVHERQI